MPSPELCVILSVAETEHWWRIATQTFFYGVVLMANSLSRNHIGYEDSFSLLACSPSIQRAACNKRLFFKNAWLRFDLHPGRSFRSPQANYLVQYCLNEPWRKLSQPEGMTFAGVTLAIQAPKAVK